MVEAIRTDLCGVSAADECLLSNGFLDTINFVLVSGDRQHDIGND